LDDVYQLCESKWEAERKPADAATGSRRGYVLLLLLLLLLLLFVLLLMVWLCLLLLMLLLLLLLWHVAC